MFVNKQKTRLASQVFRWNRQGESPLSAGLLRNNSPEIELSDYRTLPGSGGESPTGLLHGESLALEPIADLDLFFWRIYNYYCEKGLWCIIVKWVVELLSLGFTLCFSGFFLLFVDWGGLRNAKCGMDAVESGIKPCDLAKEALHAHPLVPFTITKGIIIGYLALLAFYLFFCFIRFFVQLKDTLEARKFYVHSLCINDREVQTIPWSAVLEKIVQVQKSQKLCVVKDLSAHEIVMRIMRKENYLIAMINKGVLSFQVPWWVPGVGPLANSGSGWKKNHLMLPKTLEWTLNWCILQSMFDRNFCVRRDFIDNPSSLRRRLMIVGFVMFLISPFLVIFSLVYLCLRHAEQFYNHPSTASSRRWSNLSKWIFREFNEVEHLFRYRTNASLQHASAFLKQFPSPIISLIAKFISFVSGGFAAVLIMIAFLEESLLEGHIFGRNLFWYAAVFGAVTAISRAAVSDEPHVIDSEGAMSLVVQQTHYMPKRWRGKENTYSVRREFETLFQYTGIVLLEEMTSIFVTPFLLVFVAPQRVDDILRFISDFTVHVEGVGHVCSFSTFDFENHGNSKYGSPIMAPRERRSSQGKLEKSFLSFHNDYPTWEPDGQGQCFLENLNTYAKRNFHHQQSLSPASATPQFNTHHQHHYRHRRHHHYQSSAAAFTALEPYILDCYYLSQSEEATGAAPRPPPSPPPEMYWQDEDLPKLEQMVAAVEERRRSHLQSSGVSSLFHETGGRDVNQPHGGATAWWSRPFRPKESRAAGGSFMEPSGSILFFRNAAAGHSFASDIYEEPGSAARGSGDVDGDTGAAPSHEFNSGMYSLYRTRLFSDSTHGDELNLPFDIDNIPPKFES
ncbi:autophagy 9 (APG9) [Wolffia australiana]